MREPNVGVVAVVLGVLIFQGYNLPTAGETFLESSSIPTNRRFSARTRASRRPYTKLNEQQSQFSST
jgi:hypothetical protein